MIANHGGDFLSHSDFVPLCFPSSSVNGSRLPATGVDGHVTQPGPIAGLNLLIRIIS